MKLRLPLYAKILLWLTLNLLLLAVGLYLFARVEYHFGLDSLLAGRAGDRIKSVANVIVSELEERPRSDWDRILQRFSDAYQVRFSLFARDEGQIAGARVELPKEVRDRITGRLNTAPPPPDAEMPPPHPPGGPRFDPPIIPGGPPGDNSRMMLHTSNPSRYWVIVRTPVRVPGRRPLPTSLLAESSTLSAGGLFLEWKPWLAVCGGVLLFSMLFWLPIMRSITHAIKKISDATGRISEGHFDVRVSTGRNDELGLLAHSVNRMGERLSGFVKGQKRFLGDIAHELCSPLARMQVALAILEERAEDGQRAYVVDVREDVQEMANLVEELLSFSKAALGTTEIELQPVNLAEIAQKAVDREAEGTTVEIQIPEDLQVYADPGLLQRCLSNLIRNACRYAGHAGPVTIAATHQASGVTLTVEDRGPGIPPEAVAKIFDPFYRLDSSRDRNTGGVGLGLAIVKTCVESCGGTVKCENREPTGLRVVISLRGCSPQS